MRNLVQVTPFMHVANLQAALAFFTEVLGFDKPFQEGNYAYVRREGVAFRLVEDKDPKTAAPPGNRRVAYYVEVRDVDTLYGQLAAKLARLPERDVQPPADKPYGQRELLILAPDGNMIAFGQPIADWDVNTPRD